MDAASVRYRGIRATGTRRSVPPTVCCGTRGNHGRNGLAAPHGPPGAATFSPDMVLDLPLSATIDVPPLGTVDWMLVRLPLRLFMGRQVCSAWAVRIEKIVKIIWDRNEMAVLTSFCTPTSHGEIGRDTP